MPKCTDETVGFGRVGRRIAQAAFDGGDIVSDGGVLLLKQAHERPGLTRSAVLACGDERRSASIQYSVRDLLAPRSGDAVGCGKRRAAGLCAPAQSPGDRCHIAPSEGGFVRVEAGQGCPKITLLSPTPDRLADLFKDWDAELARLRRKESDKPTIVDHRSREAAALAFPALAQRMSPLDRSTPKGSAIDMLLEHLGASILLGADAFAPVLAKALKSLALSRGLQTPLQLDVFKLSHHGSRANLDMALLCAVHARHCVVSTHGAIFNHPDDEAIAKLLTHVGKRPCLWFNYGTPRNRRWAQRELQAAFDFNTVYPDAGSSGVPLELPSTTT